MKKFVHPRKRKKYLFLPHKNNSSFSLCIITHHRGATLSLFHEVVKEEEEEDSKEFVDVRRARETASKSAARRVMFALGRYEHLVPFLLFFSWCVFPLNVKSQRVLDIHFL